jgi:hypothetical protein
MGKKNGVKRNAPPKCVLPHTLLRSGFVATSQPWGWKWMEHESSFNKSNKSIFILQLLKFDLRADLQPTNPTN